MSPRYADEWVRKAEADRVTAQACLRLSRRSKDQAEIACFHAEQCVEKYLKALLARSGRTIARTHDLEVLAGMLEKVIQKAFARVDLERLTAYAVEIRYPGTTATRAEAAKAIAAMDRLRQACRSFLPLR